MDSRLDTDVWFDWVAAVDPDDRKNLLCVVSEDVYLRQWGIDAVLPKGFASDGMSIPRFFWRWIGPKVEAQTVCPGIIHDWLYTSKIMTRKDADEWLRRALLANGVSASRARLVYWGVRMGGGSHWK